MTELRTDRAGESERTATSAVTARGPAGGRSGRRPSRPARAWLAPPGRLGVVALVVAVLLALASTAFLVTERLTALPGDAVLRVGDVTVTESDFRQRVAVLIGLYGTEEPAPGPERDRFDRDVAQAVATSIVLDRAADERGVRVADLEARRAVEQMVATRFGGDRTAFARALGGLRVSETMLTQEFGRQIRADGVYRAVTAPAPAVTDADVAQAYEQRRAQLVVPEQRRLRNIVVDTPDRARALADQARGGADVAALASANSMDRSTVPAGGDLGLLRADQLERPVADAAFAQPVNGIYGPVQSRFGWNVGQVTEIVAPVPQTLDQVREPLRARVTEERRLAIWTPWLTEQVRAARVEYADRYRPANPDVLPVGEPR